MGDRLGNLRRALTELRNHSEVKILQLSSIYETEPVEYISQPLFLNGVCALATEVSPRQLLLLLQKIEKLLGRRRSFLFGPRLIDLDLLLYGQEIIREEGLTIPHPKLEERAFVLIPLNEIAPQIVHPVKKVKIETLLKSLNDPHRVVKWGSIDDLV